MLCHDPKHVLNDELPLRVELPPGSDRGPMIDRVTLQRLGAQSSPAFRAWVRLPYLWNTYGTRRVGRGKNKRTARIHATRPRVSRNVDGAMLDHKGDVIRDHRGAPVKLWSDPRAVRLGGEERNPAADRIPVLTDADLVALCYDNRHVSDTAYRYRLVRAKEALRQMQKDGHIVIERNAEQKRRGERRRGWRVLQPRRRKLPQ